MLYVLDNVIQNVTSTAFRVFGRAILRNGLGGGGGSSSGGGASRVNVVLPTYPPDEDEDYDDEDDVSSPGSDDNVDLRVFESSSTAASTQIGETVVNTTSTLYTVRFTKKELSSKAHQILPEYVQDDGEMICFSKLFDTRCVFSSVEFDSFVINLVCRHFVVVSSLVECRVSIEDLIGVLLLQSPANDDDNTVAKRHVRVVREAEAEEDQDGAESAPEPAEDLSNVDADDTDRNKRYLPFGGTVSAHGSTGGSGNFLFDIIRSDERSEYKFLDVKDNGCDPRPTLTFTDESRENLLQNCGVTIFTSNAVHFQITSFWSRCVRGDVNRRVKRPDVRFLSN
ncbi:hypothetical protein GEV33_005091 [Tenebrio molitor]|uniref:Uncharacterized protein n=1 Tax=Tenebrio molitor TaxID=7067 RepID=A0A8J6LE26_TENMO|nr:hypothetical protein GEV33_005091 [Tenebrio molitor]